jgi:hypothetical protein
MKEECVGNNRSQASDADVCKDNFSRAVWLEANRSESAVLAPMHVRVNSPEIQPSCKRVGRLEETLLGAMVKIELQELKETDYREGSMRDEEIMVTLYVKELTFNHVRFDSLT